MSPDPLIAGAIGIVILVVLLFLQMPIMMVFVVVGFFGVAYLAGFGTAITVLQTTTWVSVSNYLLSSVPFFILMGVGVTVSGVVADLYDTANKWVRQLPGGLAIATELATMMFGAICGSSMATAATMGAIAYPEMRKHKYSKRLATGCIAAGGSIASLIPPSIPMVIIGLITELSIGKLLIAGILPGVLVTISYSITVFIIAKVRPDLAPAGEPYSWRERFASLKGIWMTALLFLVIIGGIYLGVFTSVEAAAIGAVGAFVFLIIKRKFNRANVIATFRDTGMTVGALLPIIIGVYLLNSYFVLLQLPKVLADFIVPLQVSPYVFLILVVILYLILGCFLEPLAMWLLTIPVLMPAALGLGIDGIWFAVIALRAGEIGLITPPVGMNVFIMKAVVKEVPMSEIFWGIMPFLATDVVTMALMIFIPQISLFLPYAMQA